MVLTYLTLRGFWNLANRTGYHIGRLAREDHLDRLERKLRRLELKYENKKISKAEYEKTKANFISLMGFDKAKIKKLKELMKQTTIVY